MSNSIIKYAFTAGEISKTLYGRSDLEQYDLGLARAENWIVDYRGGLSTRGGYEFIDFVMFDNEATKFESFRFNADIANVYVILFGDNYIRFLQDGGYVTEAAKTITGIAGNVVTVAAHGYLNGQWIKVTGVGGFTNLNGRTFEVRSATTNTFELYEVPTLVPWVPQGAFTSSGSAARIYTLASPYDATVLEDLVVEQRRDLLRLTHPDFAIRNLIREGHTSWVLELEDVTTGANAPAGLTATASATGDAGTLYAVTAILEDGTETGMSYPRLAVDIVNFTTEAGSVTLNWDTHPTAVSYNIYRSIVISDGDKMTRGYDLGYIGHATGTQFVDSNIVPDFTKTPPLENNPFAAGRIETIFVTAGGTGYDQSSTVSVSGGGGSGFRGVAIANSSGAIVGVRILSRGSGYNLHPTVSFTGGSGATATATSSPLTGGFPAVSAVFQQRQLYAATTNEPLTIWGSKPGKHSNFDYSEVTVDSDSYEFEVDSAEVSPIRHLVPMRGGLVIMSQTGIWQLNGGTTAGPVTPTNALADPQTYTGVSKVKPLKVGPDLLYIEGKGFTVRLLSYNDYARVYSGEDKSIVSNHLFAFGKRISSWAFAENPYKVVYAVRTDGAMLNFTIVKEEKVFAWTWSSTKGKFLDCKSVEEDGIDRTYVTVERLVNGRVTKFIERSMPREIEFSEDTFAIDSGLSLPSVYPNAILNASAPSGDAVTFTASASIFADDSVGKVIRMGGGKIIITDYLSATQVVGRVMRSITDVMFQDPLVRVNPQEAGSWTMDTPVTLIGGLWHLEGETVAVLADGNVVEGLTVSNGYITLPAPATKVHIGLGYRCIARTLPPVVTNAVIEDKRKRNVGVAARLSDTRGLKEGEQLEFLYAIKERTTEVYGEPTNLQDGVKVLLIEPHWDEDAQVYFVQDYPLPATLLGFVLDMEVGDDTD